MKKIFLILLGALMFSMNISAQDTIAIDKTKFFDNTYVGIYGQVSAPLTFDQTFPINPGIGVKIGKWITPALAFNIDAGILFGSAMDGDLRYSLKNSIRALNLGVNLQVDMFNLFKYKEDRLFTIIPEVGLGWCHGFNSDVEDVNDFSAKTGIQFAFNLGTDYNWQLYIEPAVLWDLTGNYGSVQMAKNNSQLAIQVGVNYRFKNHDDNYNFTEYDINALNAQINELRAQAAAIPAEVTIEVPVETPCYDSQYVVFFAKGSYEITDSIAELNIPEGAAVNVYGYASPEGTEKFNATLSQDRANVVAEALKAQGIKVKDVIGKGVVGNNSNRVVIVELTQDDNDDVIEAISQDSIVFDVDD